MKDKINLTQLNWENRQPWRQDTERPNRHTETHRDMETQAGKHRGKQQV